MDTLSTLMIGSIVLSSFLYMQHEAVLCLAEPLDAYQHRDKGAEAADEEHVDVQRDAPHQGCLLYTSRCV